MEFEEYQSKVYSDWRKKLFKASGLAIFFLAIVYIIIFLAFYLTNNFEESGESVFWYIIQRIVIPLAICVFSYIITKRLCKSRKSDESKNLVALQLLTTIACVITVFNNYFVLVFSVPTISVIASLTFGDKKVIRNNLIMIYIGLIFAFVTFALDNVNRGQIRYIYSTIFITIIYYLALSAFAFSLSNVNKKIIDIAGESLMHREVLLNRLHLDSLTGLYNKGYLTEFLTEIKGKEGYLIAIMDLDNFKKVNDIYGHLCGDEILIRFSQILDDNMTTGLKFFRFGGDEFVIVYKGKSDKFVKILENVQNELRAQEYEFNQGMHLTVSIGATSLLPEDSIETVFERSDKLMYEAKNTGKDCCVHDF